MINTTTKKQFSLFDFCKKRADKIQVFGKETIDEDGGVHSMFLRKKNLKFFCCSFEKNVFLRMCIQQQMRMFSMSH